MLHMFFDTISSIPVKLCNKALRKFIIFFPTQHVHQNVSFVQQLCSDNLAAAIFCNPRVIRLFNALFFISMTIGKLMKIHRTPLSRLTRRSVCVCLFVSSESPFVSLVPSFTHTELAELDEVREFRADIEAFPTVNVVWHKDGVPLGGNSAEMTTSLRQISETK